MENTFLHGPSGKQSHSRVISTFVVVLILGVWAFVSVEKKELQPIESGPQLIAMSALAAALGSKYVETITPSADKPAPAA